MSNNIFQSKTEWYHYFYDTETQAFISGLDLMNRDSEVEKLNGHYKQKVLDYILPLYPGEEDISTKAVDEAFKNSCWLTTRVFFADKLLQIFGRADEDNIFDILELTYKERWYLENFENAKQKRSNTQCVMSGHENGYVIHTLCRLQREQRKENHKIKEVYQVGVIKPNEKKALL